MPIDWKKYSHHKPDPYWRASRIAARLYLRKKWSLKDRRLVEILVQERGVEDRLIDQSISYVSAPKRTFL